MQLVHSGTTVLRRGYRGTKDVRNYYEDIKLPGNYAVVGDAVARFNPCVPVALWTSAILRL